MPGRSVSERLRALVFEGLPERSFAAYGFAALCVVIATVARMAIDLVVPNTVPFATYFPAVLLAALVGGWGAAAFAWVLSAAIAIWAFVPPGYQFHALSPTEAVNVVLFLLAAAAIVWVASLYRGTVRKLAQEESYRQVVVDELGHRVKNKLATVYAILRHELRDHRDVWDSVAGRLRALSAADDFLIRSDGKGIDLREILKMELEPYSAATVNLNGCPVVVQDKLAVVLALVFHELATNAAKYGALSSANGSIDITWGENDEAIAVEWREHGGPQVTAPERRSFGSKLIERSLDAFGGSARLDFAATGLVCRMRLPKDRVSLESVENRSI